MPEVEPCRVVLPTSWLTKEMETSEDTLGYERVASAHADPTSTCPSCTLIKHLTPKSWVVGTPTPEYQLSYWPPGYLWDHTGLFTGLRVLRLTCGEEKM